MGWTDPLDFGHSEAFPELRACLSIYTAHSPGPLPLGLPEPHLPSSHKHHPSHQHAQVSSYFVPRVGGGDGAEVDLDTTTCADSHSHRGSYPYAGDRSKCCTDVVRSMYAPFPPQTREMSVIDHGRTGGGQTWTGPTRCPAGSYCKNDGKSVHLSFLNVVVKVPSFPVPPGKGRWRLTTCPSHYVPQHLVLPMCRPRDGRGHGFGHHPDVDHRLQRWPDRGVDAYHLSEPEADNDHAVGCYHHFDAG